MEIFNQMTPIKEPKVRGRPPTYNQEYMSMVAKKVVEGELTYREASKTFGVSGGSISSWVRQFKKGHWSQATKVREASEKVKVIKLESHVRELKQEIGELYLENLLLKKALLYSQRIRKENSSVITSENLAQFQEDAK